MKVLFFSINNCWIPHFETELELMMDHLGVGDDVYVLTCGQNLLRCSSNPQNIKLGCIKCKRRFWLGMKEIGLSSKNIFFLKKHILKEILSLIPAKIESLEELRSFKLFNVDFGLGVISSLTSEWNDHLFDPLQKKEDVYNGLVSSIKIYLSVTELLNNLKPDRVYLFNGRLLDNRSALRACQQLGVKFYTHERGASADKYWLVDCEWVHSLSNQKREIQVYWKNSNLDENEKVKISQKWFFDRLKGIDQDWFSYIKNQQKYALPSNFDKNLTNVVIFNSSASEYDTIDDWAWDLFKDEIDALISISKQFEHDDKLKFYLRIHPNLKDKNNSQLRELHKLKQMNLKNLEIIDPENNVDSYALMNAANKVIVFSSTIGVESCFWAKPAILIGRAIYEDLDCTYNPKSKTELFDLINADLKPKPKENSFKYAFWAATRGIDFKRFKPSGFFEGSFLNEKLKAQLTLTDRIYLKYHDMISKIKRNKFTL